MPNPIIYGSLTGTQDNPQYLGSTQGGEVNPPGGGNTATSGTFVESGCGVAWTGTGLNFVIAAGFYWVLGTRYSNLQQTVTLDDGDSTHPRIDVISLNTSGVATVTEGTPAVDPSKPSIDPVTQIELTFVQVEIAATTPGITITNVDIYTENAGPTAEWTSSSSGSGWTLNSTTDPHAGSTHITGTNVANNAYFQGQHATNIDIAPYERLVYYIKPTSNWNNNRWLRIGFFNNGVQQGVWVDVRDNTFGFSRLASAAYQVVIIPIVAFNIPAGEVVNQLRMQDTGGSISFRLDDIQLQLATTGVQPVPGITQEQADARYQQLGHNEPYHFSVPIARI